MPDSGVRTVNEVLAQSQVDAVMDELDRDLSGLAPVKARIRDIAALLVVDKLRLNVGLQAVLHGFLKPARCMGARRGGHLSRTRW